MVQTLQANEITLHHLINQVGLQRIDADPFFPEWQTDLPDLSAADQQLLDKVRLGFLNLLDSPPLLEEGVRMAVLDPILFIGDLAIAPLPIFWSKLEHNTLVISLILPYEHLFLIPSGI
ncbi:MAG: hypothetical protein AB4042_19275 [Leptolyngbyaceae cyanobacterium]